MVRVSEESSCRWVRRQHREIQRERVCFLMQVFVATLFRNLEPIFMLQRRRTTDFWGRGRSTYAAGAKRLDIPFYVEEPSVVTTERDGIQCLRCRDRCRHTQHAVQTRQPFVSCVQKPRSRTTPPITPSPPTPRTNIRPNELHGTQDTSLNVYREPASIAHGSSTAISSLTTPPSQKTRQKSGKTAATVRTSPRSSLDPGATET